MKFSLWTLKTFYLNQTNIMPLELVLKQRLEKGLFIL